MNCIKVYTDVRLDPITLEYLEKSLQYLREIEEELNKIKETHKDLSVLWDTSNTAYDSLWDFLAMYQEYRREVSES